MSAELKFRHQVIDADPPGRLHDITLIADINSDGRNEVVIGGKEGPPNLFWYENPSWRRHVMAETPELEAGGVVFDINGDGRPDIVAGQQISGRKLFWFENPSDPTRPWTPRVIEQRFTKYHDQAVGDVDGDGEPELVFLSQRSAVLAYYDVPDDPTVQPWPSECFHLICDDLPDVEGLVIIDIDGDGVVEILAGPNVFHPPAAGGSWQRERFCEDWVKTRLAVGDLDDDGDLEVVLCEGESHPGRLGICRPGQWTPRLLRDDLFHPHSLQIADFTGDGRADLFVAEMGLGENADPRMFIYRNRGGGQFDEVLIARGIPTHEAKVGDLTGDGRVDIIGKPYQPQRHIDVWFNKC